MLCCKLRRWIWVTSVEHRMYTKSCHSSPFPDLNQLMSTNKWYYGAPPYRLSIDAWLHYQGCVISNSWVLTCISSYIMNSFRARQLYLHFCRHLVYLRWLEFSPALLTFLQSGMIMLSSSWVQPTLERILWICWVPFWMFSPHCKGVPSSIPTHSQG